MVLAATPQKPGTASLLAIWLLSIAGLVLLFASQGVPHYVGLALIVGGSIVSIRHGLQLRAFYRAQSRPRSDAT
jgi:hypothetical protein